MTTEPIHKRTEAEMLTMLRARHAVDKGNGPGWAFMTHVRDEASFDVTRTIDALALALWKSRGFELHGFEVKVSRSDWLRELADPDKAEKMMGRCDRWWLVAAEGVAKAPEMPTGWGLLVAQGDRLRAVVQAPRLERTPEQQLITRSWLVCLLRAAGAVPKSSPEDIEKARAEGFSSGLESAKRSGTQFQEMYERAQADLKLARDRVAAFEREAGFSLGNYYDKTADQASEIGRLVKAALEGDAVIRNNQSRLLWLADELAQSADHLRSLGGAAA